MLLHVAPERLLVQLALRLVLCSGHQLEVVERKLRVDGDEPVGPDHGVDTVAGRECVLHRVGLRRQPVPQEVLEQQLAEAAAGLRRAQDLLESAQILRALVHLGHHRRDLAELFVDLRRGLAAARQAAVERLGDVGHPAVHLRGSLSQLARGFLAQRGELGSDDAGEPDSRRDEREEDESDEQSDDHWGAEP